MHKAVERFFQLSLLGLVSAGFLAFAGSGFLDAPAGEFAASLPPSPLSAAVTDFTERYQAFRYGNDSSRLHELVPLLDRMKIAVKQSNP